MKRFNRSNARLRINKLAAENCPFFFLIDFECKKCEVHPLDELPEGLTFSMDESEPVRPFEKSFRWKPNPVSFDRYKEQFDRIQKEIKYGNTYLLNLTVPSPMDTDLALEEIYRHAQARFKLLVPGECVVFSPEPFIRIRNGFVYTHPMKGTIDATIPGARERILNDEKELAEHYTVVDLLRNDIGSISEHVDVLRFQYLEEIETHSGPILQMSSEIRGELPEDYQSNLGDLLFKLLPPGSVTGAPKQKTREIIRTVEGVPRGYYSGIFGTYSDGRLDSAVCIRFLESMEEGMIYRSGGGITFRSEARSEYEEMIQKIYVPLQRKPSI